MSDEKQATKTGSKFWWPNVSEPADALACAKTTQFIAYWIGGSYVVLGYLGGSNSDIIIGIVIAALGLGVWRNFLWAVPIVATIGIIEAVGKIAMMAIVGRVSGSIIAIIVLLYSLHGWRAWLALRKQAKNS